MEFDDSIQRKRRTVVLSRTWVKSSVAGQRQRTEIAIAGV